MTLAYVPQAVRKERSAASLATAVLTIQHARLKLRRELLVALGSGDMRAANALSAARDALGRLERELKAVAPAAEVEP